MTNVQTINDISTGTGSMTWLMLKLIIEMRRRYSRRLSDDAFGDN
jgi:hypothetical protein